MPDPRIGDPGNEIDLDVAVAPRERRAAPLPHDLYVDSLVARCRKTRVYPEKSADVARLRALPHPREPALVDEDDLAGREVLLDAESEIEKRARLGGDGPRVVAAADREREVAEAIAGGIHAVFVQEQQRARAVDRLEHVIDAVGDARSARDELRDELGEIHVVARAEFAEGAAGGEKILREVAGVVDESVRRDAEGAEARAHVDRLLVEGADDADALGPAKPRAILVELRLELALPDVVDLPDESVAVHGDAAELRSEMGMVIGPVEQDVRAIGSGNNSEKTAQDAPPVVRKCAYGRARRPLPAHNSDSRRRAQR